MSDDLIRIAEDSAKSGFFLVLGTLIATVASAATAIIVARLLGPGLYGQYALSFVIPQMLFLFAGFGIDQGIVKFAANLRAQGKIGDASKIIKNAVLLRALAGLVFFLLNFTLADFFASTLLNRPDLGFYIRIASISIIFQVAVTSAYSAYLGLDKTQYTALIAIIEKTSKAIISITLVLLGLSVAGAVLGNVAGWIIGGVAGLSILSVILRNSTKSSDDDVGFIRSFRTLTSYGTPLYVSKILEGFIIPFQSFILAIYATNVDIGNLKAAANFVTLITVFFVPITEALFPAFSKLDSTMNEKTMNEKTKLFFKFANKYTTMLIVPIATLLTVFSKEIVQIIYGSTYQTASFFLSIHCFLYFLVGLGYLNLKSLFKGLGKTRTALEASLVTLLIIVTLSPPLTKAYGVPGLIVALIFAYTAGTIYEMYVAKRVLRIEFDTSSLIKIYVIAVVSAVPSLLMLQISTLPRLVNVAVGGLLYLAIYVTLTPITKIVNSSELERVNEVVQKLKLLAPIIRPLLSYQKKILIRQKSTTKPRTEEPL